MTLTEFLLARIGEDVAGARNVLSDYAQHKPSWDNPATGVVNVGDPDLDGLLPTGDGPLAKHIARWDPARVLAECEAKRLIVALHGAEPGQHPDFCGHDLRQLPCSTLRLLALPYADHPDYLTQWSRELSVRQ